MFDVKQSELFKKPINTPDVMQEILDAHSIRTNTAALGKDIAGMVYRSCHGVYYIVGNCVLDFDTLQFVFLHEHYHILAEAPEKPHLLRLVWTREEVVADRIAEVATAKYL